ncbi:MAG: DUF669 domain-containing protein [Pyramidobacter sp.]|nr:DUF669 domain-containing protein [Pyramidobacter sp.]
MPYFKFDPQGYDPNKRTNYDLLPEGDYLCRVKSAKYDDSQLPHRIMLQLEVAGDTREVYYTLWAAFASYEDRMKSSQRYGEMFRDCGLKPGECPVFDDIERLVGRTVGAHVKHTVSKKNGNTYANVQYLLPRERTKELAAQRQAEPEEPSLPFAPPQRREASPSEQSQPQSYRQSQQRTTGPGGKAGFDRYGEAYPPAQNVSMDENDNFVPAEAEEADIPF